MRSTARPGSRWRAAMRRGHADWPSGCWPRPKRGPARVRHRRVVDGTYENLIRLTLHQAFVGADGLRAGRLLAEAHTALMSEADRIQDAGLRHGFLLASSKTGRSWRCGRTRREGPPAAG